MATSSTIAPSAFTITQAGLNAAMLAQGQGLSISITQFTLGTGYNYVPGLDDTIIHGTAVYTAAPSSWNMLSEITRDIVCIVPATAGPFTFGEIALYLSDGTLFALAAFNALQTKASAASGVANALTFHCVLNIGMSPSVIQVITGTPGVIEVVGSTNNVTGQRFMPGQPDALIVTEAVNGNSSLFLTAANEMQWNVSNYLQVDSGILSSVDNDGITLNGPAFNLMDSGFLPGDFLMQDMLGNVRVIASGSPGVANLTYPVTGLAAGATVMLLARETTLSDYVFLETVIEMKDKAQTDALNSAISLLTQTLNDEIQLLNDSLTAEEAAMNASLAQAQYNINRALADMSAKVDQEIAAAQAAITSVTQALRTLGTEHWTVTEENTNLVFRYQGAVKFIIYSNGDVSNTGNFITQGNYLRDVPFSTQTISMGSSSDARGGNQSGFLVGGYMIGRYGGQTFTYSGDAVRAAGSYGGNQNTSTSTYWFTPSSSSKTQYVNIRARFLTGSWSVVSQFRLYDSNSQLLGTHAGGGDSGYGWGSVVEINATVPLYSLSRVGFFVQCTSWWTGDYLYNPGIETLLDLTLSFAGWA